MPKVVLDAKARGQLKLTRESLMSKCNKIFTRYGEPVTLFISDASQIYIYQSQPDFPPNNPLGIITTPANYRSMPTPMRAISTSAPDEPVFNVGEEFTRAGFSFEDDGDRVCETMGTAEETSDEAIPVDSFHTPMASPDPNIKSSTRKRKSSARNSTSRARSISYSPSSSRGQSGKKRKRKDETRVMFRTL